MSGNTATAAMQINREITPQEAARRKKEFFRATAPIRQAMVDLMNLQPFHLAMKGDIVERETLWNPAHKVLFDQGQAAIDHLAEQILTKASPCPRY